MRKFLPLIIITTLFLCASCTAKEKIPVQNQDELNNDNKITTWKDKNFEALIRSYLGNFDKDIYFKDLDDIIELEIRSNAGVTTNNKKHAIPEEYWDKIGLLTSMKDIDNFNNLKKITLRSNNIEAIHVYKNCSNIEYLDLSHNNIEDISDIDKYNYLTHLDISDNYIADLKPLGNLLMLKELDLSNIGQRADNISGCIESEIDIDDIDNLRNLEHLYIENSDISNVSKLNSLSNLVSLNLYSCNIDIDELFLSNCDKLEALSLLFSGALGEKTVLDINKFDNLVNLKSLGISDVYIKENKSNLIIWKC